MKIRTTADKQDKFSLDGAIKATASIGSGRYSPTQWEDGGYTHPARDYQKKVMAIAARLHRYFNKNQAGTIVVYQKVEQLMKKMGEFGEMPVEPVITVLRKKYGYSVLDPSAVVWPTSTKYNRVSTVMPHDQHLHELVDDNVRKALETLSKKNDNLRRKRDKFKNDIARDMDRITGKRQQKRAVSDEVKTNNEKKKLLRQKTEGNRMRISKARLVEIILEEVNRFLCEDEGQTYQEFFRSKMEKYGVSSPAELDAEQKKAFFKEIRSEWQNYKVGKNIGI